MRINEIHPSKKKIKPKEITGRDEKKNNFGAELQTVCGPYERFGN
jgi:hypothetical protein